MIHKIIHKLTENDYRELLSGLRKDTHSRNLAAQLRKSAGEIDRDVLFRKLFEKKRTVENDHLLRNELSSLKKKTEEFISGAVQTDIPAYMAYFTEYTMAQWCLRSLLIAEAEKYASAAEDIALKEQSWQGLLKINRILFHINQYSKSDYQDKLSRVQTLHEKHLSYIDHLAKEEIRYADFIQAAGQKLQANLRSIPVGFSPVDSFTVDMHGAKSAIASYYEYKSRAYATEGKDSVAYLRQAIEFLMQGTDFPAREMEWFTCLGTIAMENSAAGNWEEAEEYSNLLIAHKSFANYTGRNAVLYNYCTTLLKLKKHKEAIKWLEVLDAAPLEPAIAERVHSMKLVAYVLDEDAARIKSILPTDLGAYDLSLRIYYRLLYAMYYLVRNDDEMAEREVENISQLKELGATPYEPIVKIFLKYIHTSTSLPFPSRTRKQKKERLQRDLDTFMQSHPDIYLMLPAMWIVEKWKQLLEKI